VNKVTQAVARNMKQHGGSAIVNIGSMWAKQSIKATPSSAGLHSLTQHLAMEPADYNIRVNGVSPAVVVTPIYSEFIEPTKSKKPWQGSMDFTPLAGWGVLMMSRP